MLKKLIILFITFIYIKAKEFEKINLQLDWLHQFQFAGYYVAKEKGFYTQKKLHIDINEYKFGLDLVDNVLKNKNTYSSGKSSLIIDILNGKQLHLLTAIYQNSPMVLLTMKSSNITSIEDLINKRVMLTQDAVSAASINSMIKSTGANLEKINFIPHSFKLDDLIDGKTDAMGSYLSNEPFFLKKKNLEYNVFNPKDYGFDFYGGMLFTSQEEMQKHPQRVKKFYEASIKGWEYAFSNIEETAKLIYEKYNSQNKSLESLIYEGKVLKELSGFNDGSFSKLNIKKINEIKRLYLLLGLAQKNDINLNEYIFNKKSILLSKDEKDFLYSNNIKLLFKENKPYSYTQKNKIMGLSIDLWNELNKNLNIKEKANKSTINLHYSINKNEVDQNKYLLSDKILNIPAILITKTNKNFISKLELLKNVKIAINKNSDFMELLENTYKEIEFIKTSTTNEAYELLSQDKVFGTITNSISFPHISKLNFENIKVSAQLPFKYKVYFYTKKEYPLLISSINKLAKELSKEDIENIINKYQIVLYQAENDYSWVYKYLIPLVLLLIYILFINTKLRKEIKKRIYAEKNLLYALKHDTLTKVSNRIKIESKIEKEIEKAKRFNNQFSIIFFDIDDFKKINDTYGHMTGDKVLIEVASLIKNNIRKIDSLGRWGGEEFLIVLPQTKKEQAYKLAEKLRISLSKESITDLNISLTASFGVSEYINTETIDDLINKADNAMYLSKRDSKNNTTIL